MDAKQTNAWNSEATVGRHGRALLGLGATVMALLLAIPVGGALDVESCEDGVNSNHCVSAGLNVGITTEAQIVVTYTKTENRCDISAGENVKGLSPAHRYDYRFGVLKPFVSTFNGFNQPGIVNAGAGQGFSVADGTAVDIVAEISNRAILSDWASMRIQFTC